MWGIHRPKKRVYQRTKKEKKERKMYALSPKYSVKTLLYYTACVNNQGWNSAANTNHKLLIMIWICSEAVSISK